MHAAFSGLEFYACACGRREGRGEERRGEERREEKRREEKRREENKREEKRRALLDSLENPSGSLGSAGGSSWLLMGP